VACARNAGGEAVGSGELSRVKQRQGYQPTTAALAARVRPWHHRRPRPRARWRPRIVRLDPAFWEACDARSLPKGGVRGRQPRSRQRRTCFSRCPRCPCRKLNCASESARRLDCSGGTPLDLWLGKSIIPFSEMLWRFGLASLFGLLLGLDREVRGISVGVRTHMLVALSSAPPPC
jgi:hypothetical protein